MAQILANKNPIDSNPRKAVGFGFPINGDAVFVPTYTTRDQIKANLVNYLLTNRGERVFNPNYGANLRAQVFEIINEDNLDNLESIIIANIGERFPLVEVKQIEFNPEEDRNILFFTLKYTVVLLGFEDEINIELT
jgi:phage baseplate assembly protein W|tara:strand:- start:1666 stop:2073 length:408 start_codon:yes stop_codon:yes gene_type:complete